MSDDIVKTLLESLTPEQKQELIQGILNSNVKSDASTVKEEAVSSPPENVVNEDFSVTRNKKESNKKVVKFRKNEWVDSGEMKDDSANFEKLEKTRTPRRRGKPNKKKVECHICGKTFAMNENLIYGEYIRCNRCTGR
tara:strand:+ start:9385 stop:9798 length:414 start_codon:yes stop_codon:yes gene_type:complete